MAKKRGSAPSYGRGPAGVPGRRVPSGRKPGHRSPTRSKPRGIPVGTLKATARGTGVVETAEGSFYIPERRMREAMNGDRVQVRPLGDWHAGLPTAAVTGVVERAVTTFAGTYVEDGPLRAVLPIDERLLHDFVVDPADPAPRRLGLRDGDLVCARIAAYPTRRAAGVATVERVLGDAEGETAAIEAVIAAHDLAVDFPPEALDQARRVEADVERALREPGRRDIRTRTVVTIDPDDARDFDDALSVEPLEQGGWRVGVHIADVSAYVGWGSPIDLAARQRATSTYLADRVLPMLPEELSCDVCSLRPREDRLAVSVDLEVDPCGRVVSSDMYPSVIRSNARLTYAQADAVLRGETPFDLPALEPGPDGAVPDLAALLHALDRVRALRQALRRDRGAIEFVSTEARVVLDAAGRPEGVSLRRSTPATLLVEEAMLAANEAVARRLEQTGVPAAFRVHEPPAQDSLEGLVPVLTEIGCLEGGLKARLIAGDPHAVQGVLDAVAGKPEEELVSALLLRAMKRATYEPANWGHYGLGAPAYCHFTSPIRRYPDLLVHRSLKAVLAGGMKAMMRRELEYEMPGICRQSSKMERVAAAAAYESQAVKLAEYMERFIGQTFAGTVTSVQPFGLFVRLDETCAEGLLRTADLGPGRWGFDEARCQLENADDGAHWRLGQRIEVRVRSTDAFRGRVDFALPRPARP